MIESDSTTFCVRARWVFPVCGPPIERGIVEVVDGIIAAVHDVSDSPAIDLGNVAILPGFVNAHAHLEFSDLVEPFQPPLPFTEWIKSLVAYRRDRPASAAVLQQGLAESCAAGTSLVGEIATQDWPADAYRNTNVHTVAFRELIAMLPERIAAQLEIAKSWLDGQTAVAPWLSRGLSPHAPYSVHPDLYRGLVSLARDRQAPLAIHLAETQAELEFLSNGSGEFVAMLQRFNAWDQGLIPRGTRPLDYLKPLADVPHALVIHGNYLSHDEIDWLAGHPHITVVYCPRTHHYFGHPTHPWRELLERGINVALGTDGRSSNPDLGIWNEVQFLAHAFPHIDPAELIKMATQSGAQALGKAHQYGTLEPGKQGRFMVIHLPEPTTGNPYHDLLCGVTGK